LIARWTTLTRIETGPSPCRRCLETGADPGHGPARRTYEKADFKLVPVARYFKAL
jgi:hypothetical protein